MNYDYMLKNIIKMEHTTQLFYTDYSIEETTYNETNYDGVTYISERNYILDPKNVTGSLKTQLKMYDIFIPLLGIFIITTNFAVVISSGLLIKKGQQPRCTYLLLGNVAMADLVTGVAVVFGQAFPNSKRTHTTCSIMLGLIVSSTLTSVYSVALIAIDRFIYILHGLNYNKWMYPRRVRLMIAATWLLGTVIGFLPMMGLSGDTQNGRICWYILLATPKVIIATSIIGLIPLLIVCILYSIILHSAIQKVIQLRNMDDQNAYLSNPTKLRAFRGGRSVSQQFESTLNISIIQQGQHTIQSSENTGQQENINKSKIKQFFNKFKKGTKEETLDKSVSDVRQNTPSKWKAIKVVLFTTGSFILTWVPYFLACTLFVLCDPEVTPERCQKLKFAIASPLAILGFVNSLLNPIIYAWWHHGFRKSIKKLCCKRKTKYDPKMMLGNKNDKTKSTQTLSSQTLTTTLAGGSNVIDTHID